VTNYAADYYESEDLCGAIVPTMVITKDDAVPLSQTAFVYDDSAGTITFFADHSTELAEWTVSMSYVLTSYDTVTRE